MTDLLTIVNRTPLPDDLVSRVLHSALESLRKLLPEAFLVSQSIVVLVVAKIGYRGGCTGYTKGGCYVEMLWPLFGPDPEPEFGPNNIYRLCIHELGHCLEHVLDLPRDYGGVPHAKRAQEIRARGYEKSVLGNLTQAETDLLKEFEAACERYRSDVRCRSRRLSIDGDAFRKRIVRGVGPKLLGQVFGGEWRDVSLNKGKTPKWLTLKTLKCLKIAIRAHKGLGDSEIEGMAFEMLGRAPHQIDLAIQGKDPGVCLLCGDRDHRFTDPKCPKIPPRELGLSSATVG